MRSAIAFAPGVCSPNSRLNASRRCPIASASSESARRTRSSGACTFGPSHIAERDRVTEGFGGRDRMLPGGPGRATEDVTRARLELEREDLSAVSGPALETHPARRQQRHPHDLRPEPGRVAVPADPRPGGIAGDERLLERGAIQARERRGPIANPCQLGWYRLAAAHARRLVHVAEVSHGALRVLASH